MLPPGKVDTGICLPFLDVLIYEETVCGRWLVFICLYSFQYEGGKDDFKNSEFQMCYSFIKLLQCFIFFEALRFLLS